MVVSKLSDGLEAAAVEAAYATPKVTAIETSAMSAAISLKRIADALERPALPDGPIYWSMDEKNRMAVVLETTRRSQGDEHLAVANEAIAIMRDRAKQGA